MRITEGVVERTSFARGDAQRLDFPDRTFDAVTSNYVYHNIPGRDRKAILLETLRVLKKGGDFAYGVIQAFVTKPNDLGYERAELITSGDGSSRLPGKLSSVQFSFDLHDVLTNFVPFSYN